MALSTLESFCPMSRWFHLMCYLGLISLVAAVVLEDIVLADTQITHYQGQASKIDGYRLVELVDVLSIK